MSLFLMVFCLLFTIACLITVVINLVRAHVWREKGKSFDIGYQSGRSLGLSEGWIDGRDHAMRTVRMERCKVCGHLPYTKRTTTVGTHKRPILTEVIDE
jgi:hypothetical protein